MEHRAPSYRLLVNGVNITPKVNGRLIDLTLDETPGDEADTLSITISDHDGALEIPPKGAEIDLAIGWRGQALIEKGTFIVDEASFDGPPDQIRITARAADMRKELPVRRTKSWDQTTVGDIVRTIAANIELEAVLAENLAAIAVDDLDQTNESDLNLPTRPGQAHDAIATVNADRLIFEPGGTAKTVSGNELPLITISPKDGDRYSYRETDRDGYTGAAGYFVDLDTGRQSRVVVGSDERVKALRGTFASAE